jgi:DNA-binding XRE family transcriptional regulator
MRTYVYLHVDPLDKSERYVGITINLKMRLYQHMHDTSTNPDKIAWLQGLKAQGLKPEVQVLEECRDPEHAREREIYWIGYYIERGAHLLNVSGNPLVVKPPVNPKCAVRFCSHVRYWRKKRQYSQSELGALVGVQAQSIANYERSRYMPHLDTRRKLAEVLKVPVDELFEIDERPLLATA